MLSDEEKKAYDNLIMLKYFTMEKEDKQAIDTILNLIEKQSKEIEELKEDKYGLEEEVQIQAKNLMLCEEALCEMQDKIKAKIEYYEKIDNVVGVRILESLLEKE